MRGTSVTLAGSFLDPIRGLFIYQFMVNALWAGTVVAIMAGALGWFMVLRGQTFAGHTVSIVGFPGAAAATLIGVSPVLGYFVFCTGAAGVIAALPGSGTKRGFNEESAVIGSVQSLMLASGFLFVTLYAGNLNGLTSLLFGNFLGITTSQVLVLFAVAVPAMVALVILARPLLFSSVDPDVARAAGVPTRALSISFLLLLGLAVAEASQITGSLLVFALLVLPPATAQAFSVRPLRSLALSIGIGVAVAWTGLGLAYYHPYPTGTFITSLSFAAYMVARLSQRLREHRAPSPVLRRRSVTA
jgi:zinc/manganese transport system permease protein